MAIATVPEVTAPRELTLLKAIGLDKLSPEQRELALNIASRYDLDLLLKHLVLIDGRPYITRDGLLHIAHRSGQLDGIDTSEPSLTDGFWRATCSVYRKDMSRPFTYAGRYPEKGRNAQFAPEMAVKVAEVMALRRAFDVAAPTAEERWDTGEPVTIEPVPPATLAERAAAKAQSLPTPPEMPQELPEEPESNDEPSLTVLPLSAAQFNRKLVESKVPVDVAAAAFHAHYPDVDRMASLSDEQRGELWAVVARNA